MTFKRLYLLSVAAFLAASLSISAAFAQTVTTNKSTLPDATIVKNFWESRFEQKRAYLQTHSCDLLFMGDSITHIWDDDKNQASWKQYFGGLNAFDIGISGARTETLIWMLDNGILGSAQPKVIVLLVGTNNIDPIHFTVADTAKETVDGDLKIVSMLHQQRPDAKILLLGIFPRGDQPALNSKIKDINRRLKRAANNKYLFFQDIGNIFLLPNGNVNPKLLYDLLHPTPEGFFAWAKAIDPTIHRLLSSSNTPLKQG